MRCAHHWTSLAVRTVPRRRRQTWQSSAGAPCKRGSVALVRRGAQACLMQHAGHAAAACAPRHGRRPRHAGQPRPAATVDGRAPRGVRPPPARRGIGTATDGRRAIRVTMGAGLGWRTGALHQGDGGDGRGGGGCGGGGWVRMAWTTRQRRCLRRRRRRRRQRRSRVRMEVEGRRGRYQPMAARRRAGTPEERRRGRRDGDGGGGGGGGGAVHGTGGGGGAAVACCCCCLAPSLRTASACAVMSACSCSLSAATCERKSMSERASEQRQVICDGRWRYRQSCW